MVVIYISESPGSQICNFNSRFMIAVLILKLIGFLCFCSDRNVKRCFRLKIVSDWFDCFLYQEYSFNLTCSFLRKGEDTKILHNNKCQFRDFSCGSAFSLSKNTFIQVLWWESNINPDLIELKTHLPWSTCCLVSQRLLQVGHG